MRLIGIRILFVKSSDFVNDTPPDLEYNTIMKKKVNFNSIFKLNEDGSIEPLKPINIGGIQMNPGVRLHRGVSLGGVDLFDNMGRDFSVEESDSDGVMTLVGIYEY